MNDITKIISACGDICSECPRYIAHKNNDIGKLKEIAQLWYRLGLRNAVLPYDELRCNGCDKNKTCGYHIVNCENLKPNSNCGECNYFPCEKIELVFQNTEKNMYRCKDICTESEFEELDRAFFKKQEILTEISNQKNNENRTEN